MRDEKTAARTFAQLNDKQEELERKKAKLQEELGVQGGRKGEVSFEFHRTSSFPLALAFALFAGFICGSRFAVPELMLTLTMVLLLRGVA